MLLACGRRIQACRFLSAYSGANLLTAPRSVGNQQSVNPCEDVRERVAFSKPMERRPRAPISIYRRMQDCSHDRKLFFDLMRSLQQSPQQLNAADLISSIHMIAMQKWTWDRSSIWLLKALKDRVAEIRPQELPKVVRALSYLPSDLRSGLVNDVAAYASSQLRELNMLSMAAVLRGFAHMRVSWDVFWSSASLEIGRRSSELCPMSFSNILWSLGVVQRPCTMAVVPALCVLGSGYANHMNATDIGSCLWAATRLDIRHRPFISGLIERAGIVADDFDEVGLVRVMQGLVYFKEQDMALLSRLSLVIHRRIQSMSVDNIVRIYDCTRELQSVEGVICPELACFRQEAERLIKTNQDRANKSTTA